MHRDHNPRTRLSLDGDWDFWLDPAARLDPDSLDGAPASAITVPGPWQAQSEAWRDYAGVAWYRRSLELPAGWLSGPDRVVVLGVEAADYAAEAWLNGVPAGEHRGGYLPFELDLTAAARPGSNTLTIRVDDSPAHFAEIPHGKQGWYGPLSGLWQPVWVESRPALHLQALQVFPDLEHGCVEAQVEFSRPAPAGTQLTARLTGPDGQAVAQAESAPAAGARGARFDLPVPSPRPWSPASPCLYTLVVELAGPQPDTAAKTFGFRSIEARDGRLYLNGEPLYLRAALDQDYYPEAICTPPGMDFLEDQVRKAKELGLNCLRCHIKVPDPRYYEAADRLGMLVWAELPNWSTFTPQGEAAARETFEGVLRRDGHHPSIVIWTLINEDWGMDLVGDPTHRLWLKSAYSWLKNLDPTRLVVDNSACEPNFHVQTDLEDYHYYRQIPDHRLEWDAFVQAFARRAPFTFSPHGDAVRSGKEPLILSEFGNWGLPDLDLQRGLDGRAPWWCETGIEWGEGVVYPSGVKERFRRLGLEQVFGSWKAFTWATQQQELLALKYQIESMRRHPEIAGYVITELTDVHWEANGLLDLERRPKAFHHQLDRINSDTVILPGWERTAWSAGETVRLPVSIAHAGSGSLPPARLAWRLAESRLSGELQTGEIAAGEVREIGELAFTLPKLAAPASRRLELELLGDGGTILARSWVDLALFPQRGRPSQALSLFCDDPALAAMLEGQGYPLAAHPQAARLFVSGGVTPETIAYVREGGSLLVLADSGQAEGETRTLLPKICLQPREGTPWDGDWASSFAWLKRSGAFARLPGGPLLDHSFDRVFPHYVMTGFGDWDYQAQVHAGLVVGWVHRPAALIAERRYGRGRAVLNAFRIEPETPARDPAAAALLDALIELAGEEPR